MEPHQQQQANEDTSSGSGKAGSFICRPSSTRWTPTPEQIRILKDLYYNNGVRSPTAEQIQKISARLRHYGKIEGKNVFYWFQNHKARERQKMRLTTTNPTTITHDLPMQQHQQKLAPTNCGWKPEDYLIKPHLNTAPSSSTGHGVYTAAQMGNYGTYGSVTMEKSFRDCSISSGVGGGSITHKFGWVGIDPYTSSSYSLFGNKKEEEEDDDHDDHDHEEEENEESGDHIETLPLFPMHGEDNNFNTTFCNIKPYPSSYYSGRYGGSNDGHGSSRASLELSLNSYTSWSSGPM